MAEVTFKELDVVLKSIWITKVEALHEIRSAFSSLFEPRPIAEYQEDMGDVVWWKFPIDEPPYVGSPNDLGFEVLIMATAHTVSHGEHEPYQGSNQQRINVGGWPGYHTHFTPIPIPREPANASPPTKT